MIPPPRATARRARLGELAGAGFRAAAPGRTRAEARPLAVPILTRFAYAPRQRGPIRRRRRRPPRRSTRPVGATTVIGRGGLARASLICDPLVATGEQEAVRKDDKCLADPPVPPRVGRPEVAGLPVKLLGDPAVDAGRALQPGCEVVGVVGADVSSRPVPLAHLDPTVAGSAEGARNLSECGASRREWRSTGKCRRPRPAAVP